MGRSTYSFQKRQRELAKKKKQEEKREEKAALRRARLDKSIQPGSLEQDTDN